MLTTFQRLLSALVSGSAAGLVAGALIATPAFGQATETKGEKAAPKSEDKAKEVQDSAKDTSKAAKDAAKDTRDAAKDTAKDARDSAKDTSKAAKDAAKDTRDTAKESAKDARDSAKDTSKAAKDAAKDTRDAAKDAAKDSRDSARDTAKDTRDSARDTARDTRDSARDARDSARDSARDTRDSARDAARDRDSVRDTRDTRDTRDARDVTRDTRDSRDVRDTRDIRDRDVTRDTRDSRDIRDTRTTRDSRSAVSRSQIENFRADSVTAADLGVRFGRASDRGLVIDTIESNAVFADFGLRRDDVILSVADRRVRSEQEFVRLLFAEDYRDERITIIVLRDDREVPIYVRPARIIEEVVLVHDHYDPLREFGLVIDDSRDTIVVQRVYRESPAFRAGIRDGDVITTFRGQRVQSPREFVRLVERVEPGEIPVEVTRNDRVEQFNVDLPRRAARRPVAAPEVDVNRATPGAERREERRENRVERRDDQRGATPAAQPSTQPRNTQPARPGLLPRNR
jgi:C-terminal processing protease CtpA/Prc